jgi:hypothetical protein
MSGGRPDERPAPEVELFRFEARKLLQHQRMGPLVASVGMASLLLLLGAPLHKKTWFFGLLAALLWTTAALAFPPRTGWVTDAAGVMKPEARQSLQGELDS